MMVDLPASSLRKSMRLTQAGFSFSSYSAATGAAAGRTVDGFFAVLTYNQYDSLWMRTSEDGGATWSEPEEIADAEIVYNDRAVQLISLAAMYLEYGKMREEITLISILISSSISGKIETDAKEVCLLLLVSKGDIRTMR